VEWKSRAWNGKSEKENNCQKGDDSLRSFLFMLRTFHGIPQGRFTLREEKKQYTTYSRPALFAHLGDICVYDNYNISRISYTRICTSWNASVSAKDIAFKYFVRGAKHFREENRSLQDCT
jgi:hypothetical protein